MRIPETPPTYLDGYTKLPQERVFAVLTMKIGPTVDGRYRHWHKLRYLTPPQGLSHEEWWFALKNARESMLRELPLRDTNGAPFYFALPDSVLEMTHAIDSNASGRIEISEQVMNPDTRDRYLVSSLMEEAITSSQLEGAATTQQVAKEMIRTGRKPKDRSERMILNNYLAMRSIRDLKDKPLTPDLILQLHRILTEHTLDSPEEVGRLRRVDEPIQVRDRRDGALLHQPPPADQLPQRLAELCEFANGETPASFIHPIIRAIVLHFWLAYDHPFVDGNGRTARALFYWSMLSQGYWLCEYLSISHIVKRAPAKYMRVFLYTETDENDLTYFVLYHLHIITQAITELHEYLATKIEEIRATEALLRKSVVLNHRQLALLSHALRHPNARYSIKSHRTSHDVAYETARSDLLDLAKRALLVETKIGRTFYFSPVSDLAERLKQAD